MSITYKDLLPDDISIQDFESHKEWNIHFQDTGSYGFKQSFYKRHDGYGAYYSASQFFGNNESGQTSTGSTTTGPLYDRLLYSSLANTFYLTSSADLTSSINNFINTPEAISQMATEKLGGRTPGGITLASNFYNQNTGSVWQLPTNIIGEGIKPGSITVSHSYALFNGLTDDGKGNLRMSDGTWQGNVFYNSGIFVFPVNHAIWGPPNEYPNASGGGWRNINFKSTLTMTEHEYYCTIQDGEYNQSTNPTILSGSNNGVAAGAEGTGSYILRSLVTSSAFSPYATTVGLYNDRGDLCATGKLARPLKISDQYDISIVVRFDA